jgi:LmbE family N-acetylglucosaminyl deacetylase
MRVAPLDEAQGHVALGLVLRHLANTGVYMNADAHPDDENNGLFVQLNRGQGYRTTLATATRGNGGQNEIGPEIFEALGVLRTEELAALHRFDGAEHTSHAVDFGFRSASTRRSRNGAATDHRRFRPAVWHPARRHHGHGANGQRRRPAPSGIRAHRA